MLEVTLVDMGLVVGTIDMPAEFVSVGSVYHGMSIEAIEWHPTSGEDAIVVIKYVG